MDYIQICDFDDDIGKHHIVLKPAICYFCGEPITARKGDPRTKDSLDIHSLDGNHDNWEPSNKVPTHKKCHVSYHNTGKKFSTDFKKKLRLANLGNHRSEETKEKIRLANLGSKNPMFGNTEAAKRGWKTRRERYGPKGRK
jgi:hypothetical protein